MPKSKESKHIKIVSNASPIINLAKINRLDLLEKLYQKIIIPGAVFKELIVKGHDKENIPAIKSLIDNDIIEILEVQSNALVRALEKDLDPGESEAIALAVEINAELVILDERDARETAEIYSLKKTGFIGILMKAKKQGFIDSVKKYLDQAIARGFWINELLYHSIIEKLNE
jgi:predicted nucleic acid-binding protein